jgi:N-acetylglucosaminyl-diphospho-decaprenol L-rhamnosyltransferase
MYPPALTSTAVVTVTYNSSRHLRGFLASLREGESADLAVVIADNNSDDIEVTRELSAEFNATVLELGSNRGYGAAINAAVADLDEKIEFVLVCNPDVSIYPGAISEMVAAATADASIGSVGPKILNGDGSQYPSARNLPSLKTGIGHAVFARVWPSNPWSTRYRAESANPNEPRDVGWLSGSCVLVRRSAFDALGGFDDGFFMYFEDVDLGHRLHRGGWTNHFHPAAVVVHTGAHSTSTDSARMLRAHHDSAYRYLSKKYAAGYLAPLRLLLKIGLRIRSWSFERASR